MEIILVAVFRLRIKGHPAIQKGSTQQEYMQQKCSMSQDITSNSHVDSSNVSILEILHVGRPCFILGAPFLSTMSLHNTLNKRRPITCVWATKPELMTKARFLEFLKMDSKTLASLKSRLPMVDPRMGLTLVCTRHHSSPFKLLKFRETR